MVLFAVNETSGFPNPDSVPLSATGPTAFQVFTVGAGPKLWGGSFWGGVVWNPTFVFGSQFHTPKPLGVPSISFLSDPNLSRNPPEAQGTKTKNGSGS